jgi:GT2 family glycosyltransferase
MQRSERTPDISILIVSWNTRDLLEACLGTLPASVGDDLTYETIVVDNASRDGSLELLEIRDDISLIQNRENVGYAAAVNQAYARASGRLVLLLNSDIEFKPGALGALVAFLDARPDAAGVGPIYLNPDGSPQQHHYRLPTFRMLLASSNAAFRRLPGFSASERSYRMLDDDFSGPRPVEQPSASVLLLRRAVLPPDYLLDERFPIYFNDVELAQRLAHKQHVLWVTPDAEVFHVHGASTRQLGTGLRLHHVAALVSYLTLTEAPAKVLLFRSLLLTQALLLRLVRPSRSPGLREFVKALWGNPGSLPQAPRA